MTESDFLRNALEQYGYKFNYIKPVHFTFRPNSDKSLYTPSYCFLCQDECFQYNSLHYIKTMSGREAFVQALKRPDGSVLGDMYPHYCDKCYCKIQLIVTSK